MIPANSPIPLTIINNHPIIRLCQSSSISPSTLHPTHIQSGEPACWWEVSLFNLLNFPSSGHFLTDCYTSVSLFLLNSLLGLCAGGMRYSSSTGLITITAQAFSLCRMIPTYFSPSCLSPIPYVFF